MEIVYSLFPNRVAFSVWRIIELTYSDSSVKFVTFNQSSLSTVIVNPGPVVPVGPVEPVGPDIITDNVF